MNPDIIVPENSIQEIINFMETRKDVGLAVPKIVDERGDLQYLCKRKPSIMALFGRRFMPKKTFFEFLSSALLLTSLFLFIHQSNVVLICC